MYFLILNPSTPKLRALILINSQQPKSSPAQTQAMRRFSSRAASLPTEKESKVVMLDGTLQEFSQGATASYAIEDESDCIIFDTSKFHVGEYLLPLEPDSELESGHIYMLLPQSMLNHRLNSVDMEKFSVKIKEALLMAAVEKKFDRSSSFCGLRGMLSGPEIGEKINRREEKREKREGGEGRISKTESMEKTNKVEAGVEERTNKKIIGGGMGKINKTENESGDGMKEEKKGERKQSKCRYVWYLGFASFPIEEEN